MPGLGDGEDVTDWLHAGHSADELRAFIEAEAEQDSEKQNSEKRPTVQLSDFVAYMPTHTYIFKPTREMWPASSVNARISPIDQLPASAWFDANSPVEQMTWAPGEPMEITNRLISDGGWIERDGCTVFNLYRPPMIVPNAGRCRAVARTTSRRSIRDEAEHIVKWLAHRVQQPHEKINHALVLGGSQGIGKDTMLEPVKRAVGPWNFSEVSPKQDARRASTAS